MTRDTPVDPQSDATPDPMDETGPDLSGVTPDAGSVTMFTTSWCGFCARLKYQLSSEGLPFAEIDIDAAPEHVELVQALNGGNRTVPTLVFPDGTTATNPSLAEVRDRLGV